MLLSTAPTFSSPATSGLSTATRASPLMQTVASPAMDPRPPPHSAALATGLLLLLVAPSPPPRPPAPASPPSPQQRRGPPPLESISRKRGHEIYICGCFWSRRAARSRDLNIRVLYRIWTFHNKLQELRRKEAQ
ncbi:hypothetical protein Cni_G07336 [Canna indica]|uniref:Uncharacterized protein n=1 Tax=Canna indica TaxID=4628 RepID=A0AAQ3K070_9LILI|nr:hypothetical protein Cni_G07336 [Canna indica]